MKIISFLLTAALALILNACTSKAPLAPVSNTESGSANITVRMGTIGSLAKRANIDFSKLCVNLSAPGEATILDTVPISGNGSTTVSKTYGNLASLKTWTLNVRSYDTKDSLIHSGSATFNVQPKQTANVSLNLDARFSMLKANFYPIRDSVTRCELLVSGSLKASTSFPIQSRLRDTVKLGFDYLKTNLLQRIKLDVYGSMWGFDTLLYTADTAINPLPGVNSSYQLTLKWVGPMLPPPGQATMTVVLGAVGNVIVNGELENRNLVLMTKAPVGTNNFDLYTMNIDGANQQLLYNDAGCVNEASWNSDKSRIVFVSSATLSGKSDIFIMNGNGTNAVQINTTANSAFCPQFVNGKIWFVESVAGNPWDQDIYSMNYDGSSKTQLSTMSGQHSYFRVVSSKVYFCRSQAANSNTNEIYSANIDFTNTLQLTSGSLYTFLSDVLQDGSKILKMRHASYSSGPDNLYLMNADGTGETPFTTYPASSTSCFFGRFSPDGSKIMYSYYNGTQYDIYIMNVDGSGNTNLTNTVDYNEYVNDWK